MNNVEAMGCHAPLPSEAHRWCLPELCPFSFDDRPSNHREAESHVLPQAATVVVMELKRLMV